MDEKPIVKFDGKWWVLDSTRNGMATLWSNGQTAIIPESLIEARKRIRIWK